MGLPDVPEQHARELHDANELVRRTVLLLRAARDSGAEYVLEHPAGRGAVDSPIFMHNAMRPCGSCRQFAPCKPTTGLP
eukprot:3899671-Pleurochrysis_carterae.AAC.1